MNLAAEFSKPSRVYSDYKRPFVGHVIEEAGAGRFHSSMAFHKDFIQRIGGWVETKRADFDQQLITKALENAVGVADPYGVDPKIQYVYGWNTGQAHCQSTMRSPDDETWYDRGAQAYKEVPFVGRLEPKHDKRTLSILQELGVQVKEYAA